MVELEPLLEGKIIFITYQNLSTEELEKAINHEYSHRISKVYINSLPSLKFDYSMHAGMRSNSCDIEINPNSIDAENIKKYITSKINVLKLQELIDKGVIKMFCKPVSLQEIFDVAKEIKADSIWRNSIDITWDCLGSKELSSIMAILPEKDFHNLQIQKLGSKYPYSK
jgi:hypothetical protein